MSILCFIYPFCYRRTLRLIPVFGRMNNVAMNILAWVVCGHGGTHFGWVHTQGWNFGVRGYVHFNRYCQINFSKWLCWLAISPEFGGNSGCSLFLPAFGTVNSIFSHSGGTCTGIHFTCFSTNISSSPSSFPLSSLSPSVSSSFPSISIFHIKLYMRKSLLWDHRVDMQVYFSSFNC